MKTIFYSLPHMDQTPREVALHRYRDDNWDFLPTSQPQGLQSTVFYFFNLNDHFHKIFIF